MRSGIEGEPGTSYTPDRVPVLFIFIVSAKASKIWEGVMGFTRKLSRCSRSIFCSTASRPKAVIRIIAGDLLENSVRIRLAVSMPSS